MDELKLFLDQQQINYSSIIPLPQSGGDRKYFRIITNTENLIATIGTNILENKTFLNFTKTFESLDLPTPKLFGNNEDCTIYLQQDLGTECLLDVVLKNGYTNEVFEYYVKSLQQLAKLQILSDAKIDYDLCLASKKFNVEAALFDLNYCKTYFIDALNISYNEIDLNKEFQLLSKSIGTIEPIYFMYRDFQGRNIMVHQNNIYFIDYQGAMQGPIAYDVASLLWQAKAQLPNNWKEKLLHIYIDEANKYLPTPLNKTTFINDYYNIVLMRLLQVLGAYGRRGLLEGKSHFISSIPQGIDNISQWMKIVSIEKTYPEIYILLQKIINTKQQFI